MERQPIIEPFDFPIEVQNDIIAAIIAQEAKMPFLVSLTEDERKTLLKAEKGKATKPRGVHRILMDNPEVNKSDTLFLDRFGKQIDNYDALFTILKRSQQFVDLVTDTLLAKGHELVHQSNEGQKQIRRAADDKTKYQPLLKELKNIKPAAKPTASQVEKLAPKQGFVKSPTL